MSQTRNVAHAALTALLLVVVWPLWSGKFEPLFYGLGALSVVLSMALAVRMGLFGHHGSILAVLVRTPLYWAWLIREAIQCAWAVAKLCVRPDLPIAPKTVEVDPIWNTPTGLTVLGNSITFTPGTVTLDVGSDGRLLVHCLTTGDAEGLAADTMNRRVARLAPGKPWPIPDEAPR